MKLNRIHIRKLLLITLILVGVQNVYSQATLTVTGDWTKNVEASEITEAGNDFPGVYESSSTITSIDISKSPTSELFPWKLDVHGEKGDWDNRLEIWTQRTDNGTAVTPGATITDGTVYQQVSNTDQSFFSGTGSISQIHVQYKITGVTVLIPAGVLYGTTIVYTLTEQ